MAEKAEGWRSTCDEVGTEVVGWEALREEDPGREKGFVASGLGTSSLICFSISASDIAWKWEVGPDMWERLPVATPPEP